jgi:hypothetical protein
MGYVWEAGGDVSSCHGRATQAMFGGVGPAWQRDAGACEKHPAGAGPCVDAGKWTAATGVRTRALVRTSGH